MVEEEPAKVDLRSLQISQLIPVGSLSYLTPCNHVQTWASLVQPQDRAPRNPKQKAETRVHQTEGCHQLLGAVQEIREEMNVRWKLERNLFSVLKVADERLNLTDSTEKGTQRPAGNSFSILALLLMSAGCKVKQLSAAFPSSTPLLRAQISKACDFRCAADPP
jgi:hypothetical protein